MRILHVLYYYEPYTSGLTIAVSRTVNEHAKKGHEITVICGRHLPSLPAKEVNDYGVTIIRLPVAARLDRGIIIPSLLPQVVAAMRHTDVVQLDIPLVEAAPIALIARLMGKRVVVNHLSDMVLNRSPLTKLAASASQWSGILAGRMAQASVTLTKNRAKVSPFASRMSNLHVIAPACEVATVPPNSGADFRREHDLENARIIGFVGRFTTEKGIDVLLRALPIVRKAVPNVILALVGPNIDERTGQPHKGPWDRLIADQQDSIRILGRLSDVDLARFYHAIDVFTLPSVDFTETFGMVQVEAMLCGSPVVASSLPGVDDPILNTGYGLLVEPGNVERLANALIEVLLHRQRYEPDTSRVARIYAPAATTEAYLRLYRGLSV